MDMPIPGILERANRLLEFMVRRQSYMGQLLNLDDQAFIAVTYSNSYEFSYLLSFLSDSGLIREFQEYNVQITPKGYMRYEELHARQAAFTQGFVAMWFDDLMDNAYDKGFKVGILIRKSILTRSTMRSLQRSGVRDSSWRISLVTAAVSISRRALR